MDIPEHVGWREIKDRIVVVNLERGECFELEGPGAFLWSKITQQYSIPEIADEICETYEVGKLDVQRDISNFILEIKAFGLAK